MQIVIVVLNKYLGIISFLEIASKSKWKGFLDFIKCIYIYIYSSLFYYFTKDDFIEIIVQKFR